MSLDGANDSGSRLECIGCGLRIELRIQRKKLEHVMMERSVRGSARPAIHLASRADLKTTVWELFSLRCAFGNSRRCCRNVPHDPMDLVVARLVASEIHVVHVQYEALRARGDVGPSYRRRSSFTGGDAWSGLAVLDRKLPSVRKSGDRHGHRRRWSRRATASASILCRR